MGVPLGSIIGPLMFLLYINDLTNLSNKLSSLLYADDSNFFFSHHSQQQLTLVINQELAKIYCWLNTNKLTLNISKSKCMVFLKSLPNDIDLHINNKKSGANQNYKISWVLSSLEIIMETSYRTYRK